MNILAYHEKTPEFIKSDCDVRVLDPSKNLFNGRSDSYIDRTDSRTQDDHLRGARKDYCLCDASDPIDDIDEDMEIDDSEEELD